MGSPPSSIVSVGSAFGPFVGADGETRVIKKAGRAPLLFHQSILLSLYCRREWRRGAANLGALSLRMARSCLFFFFCQWGRTQAHSLGVCVIFRLLFGVGGRHRVPLLRSDLLLPLVRRVHGKIHSRRVRRADHHIFFCNPPCIHCFSQR